MGYPVERRFLDEDFLTEKAWFAGGQPDELAEVGDAPASWIRMCPRAAAPLQGHQHRDH